MNPVLTYLRWPILITVVGLVLAGRIGSAGAPRAVGAQLVDRTVDGSVVVARKVAALVQHGSLPVYVVTAAFVASIVTVPFITHLVGGVSIGDLLELINGELVS